MGERLAEFKLYLACLFAAKRIPAQTLAAAAEPAARDVLRTVRMADFRDWRAVLAAYGAYTYDGRH